MAQPVGPRTDEEETATPDRSAPPMTATAAEADTVEETRTREVVGVLGHELLTPLTAIQGVLDLVLAGIAGDVPPALRELLETMHGNGRRLARTIANILDIERIEAGSGALHSAALVVEHVMQGAIRACEDDARLVGVQLRSSVLAPRARVWGDEPRLRDALTHVIGNAVKFSPPGGTVAVCLVERGGAVRVIVEDQGPGIPEAARETIFRKFTQLDTSDARETSGLGLGLAIAKAIVEKHNGVVDFECGSQGGTTFVIDLPATDRQAY